MSVSYWNGVQSYPDIYNPNGTPIGTTKGDYNTRPGRFWDATLNDNGINPYGPWGSFLQQQLNNPNFEPFMGLFSSGNAQSPGQIADFGKSYANWFSGQPGGMQMNWQTVADALGHGLAGDGSTFSNEMQAAQGDYQKQAALLQSVIQQGAGANLGHFSQQVVADSLNLLLRQYEDNADPQMTLPQYLAGNGAWFAQEMGIPNLGAMGLTPAPSYNGTQAASTGSSGSSGSSGQVTTQSSDVAPSNGKMQFEGSQAQVMANSDGANAGRNAGTGAPSPTYMSQSAAPSSTSGQYLPASSRASDPNNGNFSSYNNDPMNSPYMDPMATLGYNAGNWGMNQAYNGANWVGNVAAPSFGHWLSSAISGLGRSYGTSGYGY